MVKQSNQSSTFISGGTASYLNDEYGNVQYVWFETPNNRFGENTNVISASFAGVVT